MLRFIGKLFKLAFYLAAVAGFVFVLTCVWMAFDGLSDDSSHADVALVVGHAQVDTGETWPVLQARLDRVIKLYNDSKFPAIIVSGMPKDGGYDETSTMVKYLVSQGIPQKVIFQNNLAGDYNKMAANVSNIMTTEHFSSVMIVGHYYQITRLKLALHLEVIDSIQNNHTGHLSKADGYNVAREVYEFYDFAARYYLLPQAKDLSQKLSEEAKTGLNSAKSDAAKAKESVDKKIDNMAK